MKESKTRIRSLLFIPATRQEDVKKIPTLNADVYILDLEDSVGKKDKDNARNFSIKFLKKPTDFTIALRINPLDTLYGLKDLTALLENDLFLDIVIPTKILSESDIILLRELFKKYNKNYKIFPLIETISAIDRVLEIAKEIPKNGGLIFGSADFCSEITADISWESCLLPRAKIAIAAGISELHAVDAPYFDLTASKSELENECKKVKKIGFSAKLAIHPQQIETINDQFSLSKDDYRKYKKMLDLFDSSDAEIIKFENQMMGPPFEKLARKKIQRG